MRRNLIFIVLSLILIIVIVFFVLKGTTRLLRVIEPGRESASTQEPEKSANIIQPEEKDEKLAVFNNSITITGLSKDGIPPIENPKYISIDEADVLLEDWDRVFVYEADEGVFIYPQRILVWHEIVNETIDGEVVSITYCPLTASTICYTGDDGINTDNTYGTSGNLLNSNLVMYDRKTDSYIPQILGTGVNNALEGVVLETNPIHWAEWSDVVETYSEAKVLSTETGFNRDYNKDPYGSYLPYDKKSYYISGEPMFELMNDNDGTFEDKKIVVGAKHEKDYIALDPDKVREEKVLSFSFGSVNAIAFYDSSLNTVRVFNANHKGAELEIGFENNQFIDQDGIIWGSNGISESGERLEPLTYFDVLWFAWHAYYPDTEVIK